MNSPMKLLKAALILDGKGGPPLHNGAILVEGHRIKAIGNATDFGTDPRAEIVDFGSLTLTPGFIDTHVHLSGSGKETAPMDMHDEDQDTLLVRCAANAWIAICEGVTTVRDCGARNDVIFPFKAAVQRKAVPSPKLLAAGGAFTRTGGYCWFFGCEADTADELRKGIRSQVKRGADFIKIMVTGGIEFKPPKSLPGLLYFDEGMMRLAVQETTELGRYVAAHCLGTNGIRASVAAGVRSIEHCAFYDGVTNRADYDPRLGDEIVRKGIFVNASHAFCYVAGCHAKENPETSDPRLLRLGAIRQEWVKTSRKLRELGVKLIPGSDGGWYAQPFGEYAYMPILLVDEVGMIAKQAFEACTRVAAESIGVLDQVGTLEPGKAADIVAINGNPTEDIRAMGRVRMTMIDGEVMFREDVLGSQHRPVKTHD